MSGHSKWATIKHRKAQQDAKRGKLFSKLIRELTAAVRVGGPNPNNNIRLRMLIEKAKSVNMPQETIMRAIERPSDQGNALSEVTYEGYGPGGVAFYIEALTDNKHRTCAQIRRIFERAGGSLGESGCVSWQFEKKGYIAVSRDSVNEDELFEIALASGAEDFKVEDDVYEIITSPDSLLEIKEKIEKLVKPKYAEIIVLPQNYIQVDEKTAQQNLALMETLEEEEDVRNVYANFEVPDKLVQTA